MSKFRRTACHLGASVLAAASLAFTPSARAADHGDAPMAAQDESADIADVYFFLDPNDNTKVVVAMDVHGFIVPGENANFGFFDPTLRFHFQIDTTGDGKEDSAIDVTFSPQTSKKDPQIATITLPNGRVFTAPTTVSSAAAATAPAQVVTSDRKSGVHFFAGLVDDPFFFDIPAFQRFVDSVNAGHPDATVFSRGRDTFAGFNVMMIAMEMPVDVLRGGSKKKSGVIGLTGFTQRRRVTSLPTNSTLKAVDAGKTTESFSGDYVTIDRMATPTFNIVFIPFGHKDAYNRSTTEDDVAGKFVPDLVATAKKFGVDQTSAGIITAVAVTHGDELRLDTRVGNSGPGGGTNAAAGFPNGRRPGDDVIDTLLTIVNNRQTLSDNVDANDVPLQNVFPFFAPPHQPLPPGTVDDLTRF